MSGVRAVIATVGIASGLYGLVLLLVGPIAAPVSVALWFAGCVLAHDVVVAPLLLATGRGASTVVPTGVRTPLLYGVLGTLALLAVAGPVLLRGGAQPSNSSLLDRNYPAGLGAALLVVWVAVGVALAVRLTRSRADA